MVMNDDRFLQMRNNLACKDKWGSNFGNFKKIFDHMSKSKLLGYELVGQDFTPFATTF
jgi:hypothetical protein